MMVDDLSLAQSLTRKCKGKAGSRKRYGCKFGEKVLLRGKSIFTKFTPYLFLEPALGKLDHLVRMEET